MPFCRSNRQINSSGPCLVCELLEKKSIQVQATTEEETGNDAQKRKGTEGEGEMNTHGLVKVTEHL